MTFQPTPEQQEVIDYAGTAYVRACPGAGKTRTIVYRLKRLLSENAALPRRGAALLSFTNSAVDEFKEKCAKAEIVDKIGYPNFVGTFDSFLWRFIALPALPQKDDIKPTLVESWSELYVNLRSPRNIQDKGASLGYFSLEDGRFNLDSLRGSAKQVVNAHHDAYSQEALQILRRLAKKGLYSTDGARKVIAKKLQEDAAFSTALGVALRERFYEVIVDEAQDCNNTDTWVCYCR